MAGQIYSYCHMIEIDLLCQSVKTEWRMSHALQKAGSLVLLAQIFNTERKLHGCIAVFVLGICE